MSNPDPKDFAAPKIPFNRIKEIADEFRNTYWKDHKLPIDIIRIAEFDLDLDFIPIQNLKSEFDIDALLYNGLNSIAVDRDEYMSDKLHNRLRFSIAHEIGHIILHKDIYEELSFDNLTEKIEYINAISEDEYNWIEQQAYEFAGRLLVPPELLEEKIREHQNDIIKFLKDFDNTQILIEFISDKIGKYFGVSGGVIMRRIKKENLEHYFK